MIKKQHTLLLINYYNCSNYSRNVMKAINAIGSYLDDSKPCIVDKTSTIVSTTAE